MSKALETIAQLKKAQYYDLPNRNYERLPVSDLISQICYLNMILSGSCIYWYLVKVFQTNKIILTVIAVSYLITWLSAAEISRQRNSKMFFGLLFISSLCSAYWFVNISF